jgi:DNA-binding beta-propeller fold protein YncE
MISGDDMFLPNSFFRFHASVVASLVALTLLVSACGSAQLASTNTPEATATVIPVPIKTSSSTPPSGPLEYVLQITGDTYPFSRPVGLAIGQQDRLYVADGGNHRIQVFDSTGQFLMTWGEEGSGKGQFKFSHAGDTDGGMAVDAQGNVYVADSYNFRIQKFTSDGEFLAAWGSKGDGDSQFRRPYDLAIDSQGNIYVIDDYRNDIQKFDSNGKFLTKWGGSGQEDGQLFDTGGIAVDGQDHIFVADYGNHRVQKFDSNGQFLIKWGSYGSGDGQFNSPSGISVDGQGYVYVVEEYGQRIQKFDSNGLFLFKWGSARKGEGEFFKPYDVVVDFQGNIYISDLLRDRVQKFQISK